MLSTERTQRELTIPSHTESTKPAVHLGSGLRGRRTVSGSLIAGALISTPRRESGACQPVLNAVHHGERIGYGMACRCPSVGERQARKQRAQAHFLPKRAIPALPRQDPGQVLNNEAYGRL